MKALFYSIPILCLLLVLPFTTDAQNPYASLGIETKVLTLTEGKYSEFIPNQELVMIGGVMLNTKTGKVVEFLEPDTMSYSFDPTVSTRFLSVDPIARQFPELTPYQFAGNGPIANIDLDGLEPRRSIRSLNYTRSHLRVLRDGKVVKMIPNRNFNPNNPSPLTPPFVEVPVGHIAPDGSVKFNGPDTNAESAFDPDDPLYSVMTQARANAQIQASIEHFGGEDAYFSNLLQRELNGEMLTIQEQNALSGWLSRAKSRSQGDYFGRQGVYVIYKNGEIWKFGKAHLEGKLDERGRPYRLTKQVDDLQQANPEDDFDADVIKDFYGTTQEATDLELDYILQHEEQTGDVPGGNVDDPRLKKKN